MKPKLSRSWSVILSLFGAVSLGLPLAQAADTQKSLVVIETQTDGPSLSVSNARDILSSTCTDYLCTLVLPDPAPESLTPSFQLTLQGNGKLAYCTITPDTAINKATEMLFYSDLRFENCSKNPATNTNTLCFSSPKQGSDGHSLVIDNVWFCET